MLATVIAMIISVIVLVFLYERTLQYTQTSIFPPRGKETYAWGTNNMSNFRFGRKYQNFVSKLASNGAMTQAIVRQPAITPKMTSSKSNKVNGGSERVTNKSSLKNRSQSSTLNTLKASNVIKTTVVRESLSAKKIKLNTETGLPHKNQMLENVLKFKPGHKRPALAVKQPRVNGAKTALTRNMDLKSGTTTFQIQKKSKCPTWKYNREDWTIAYHANQVEYMTTLCKRPNIRKNIKRISFDDGSFLNTGCTKNTTECPEHPYYDFKEQIRINSPPCCRHHVLTMFEHVTTALAERNVSHTMISGGVIGWVRNKEMIPYDRDLDVILHIDYWNTTDFWKMFHLLHKHYGYNAEFVEDFKVKLYFSALNKNNIDIWAYWVDNDMLSIAYHGFKEQLVATMLPFQAVKFEWFDTFVPAKPLKYLDRQYGKDVWKPEKHCMVRNAEGDCW